MIVFATNQAHQEKAQLKASTCNLFKNRQKLSFPENWKVDALRFSSKLKYAYNYTCFLGFEMLITDLSLVFVTNL